MNSESIAPESTDDACDTIPAPPPDRPYHVYRLVIETEVMRFEAEDDHQAACMAFGTIQDGQLYRLERVK